MNKLIELLNRYIKEKELWNTVKEIDDDFFVNNYNNWDWYLCEQVMSKNFWFIWRLVEENKINRDKVREEADYYYIKMFDDDEILLMLLSISDSPINDLINILK